MVIVDLFSPRPKALVVPKAQATFPVELDKRALDELSLLAAHVSDAFMSVSGGQPAGIWINPPQHVMVKQLHVHVLPQLSPGGGQRFSAVGEPLIRAAQRDPSIMQKARAYFTQVTAALEKALGPSS
jgi:diadenosine tetraphosphate (Ap4A) HIT family hydrolase